MSAEQFLDRVEKTGLLDPSVLAQLRRQVAASGSRATANNVAETLVKNGYLTKVQASKLLSGTDDVAEDKPSTAQKSGQKPKPASSVDDDLGLAPLDDEKAAPGLAPVQKEGPGQSEDDDVVMLEDASEAGPTEPGLAPLDEPAPAKPQAASGLQPTDTGGLQPLDAGGGLEPVGGTPGLEPVGGTPGLEPVGGTPGLEPVGGTPGLEPAGPADGLQPMGQASGLEPIAGAGLEPLDATSGLDPVGGAAGSTPMGGPAPQMPKAKFKKNVWDSPLLLVGGGALLLLLIIGIALYFILQRETAAEILAAADEDYRSESYAQAIDKYERYLDKFPDDPNVSMARVRIGTSQLFQRVDAQDKRPALEAANDILPKIENEAAFADARGELASILPDIAGGFASQATKAEEEIEKAQELLDLAEEAMKLVDNPSYIPTSLRKTVETKLNRIGEDMQLAERNINRTKRLAESVDAIRTAANAGKTVEAYEERRKLLREYPELERNERLLEAVLVITERERALVKVVDELIPSSAEDHPAPSEFQVALASRRGEGAGGSEKHVVFFQVRGALYGLQATTGKLLWRRFVGHETLAAPQPISKQAGAHVIAVDSRHDELLRLNDQTGELVWRLPIGEPFSNPVIYGKRVLLASKSGRVLSVDSETGEAKHAVLPQGLQVSPGTSKLRHLYQVGDHSNLYVLDEESLECKEVYYLGHKPGTIETPPVMVLGHLFVAVNSGEDYCDLHILDVDDNGLKVKPAMKAIRLNGHITVTPLLAGARVVVVTDLGAIHVLEVNPANADKPVQDAVEPLVGSFSTPVTGYAALDRGVLYVGDRQFTKYEIQTSTTKLLSKWIKNKRDTFVTPPLIMGDTVFHVRRRQNSPSYTASAVHVDDGKLLWEVDLATPAALLTVDLQKNVIHSISAQAELFEATADVFRAKILDQPSSSPIGAARTVAFNEATPMGNGRWAFTSPDDRKRMVVYDPDSVSASARLQSRTVKAAGEANATAGPVYFQGGLLMPLDNGQVVLVDPATGDEKVRPFQPRLEGGTKVQWQRAAVIGSDAKEFVIADDRRKLYRVGIKDQPQPHLAHAAQAELTVDIVSALAAVGDTVYGVVRGSGGDTVVSFAATDLSVGREWPLEGRIAWGPEQLGDVVLMASDREGLLCFEAGQKQRWTAALKYGAIAGRPLRQGSDFILTSVDGAVWMASGADGSELQRKDLGEPLYGGAVRFGTRLLLPASDGALYVIPALPGT